MADQPAFSDSGPVVYAPEDQTSPERTAVETTLRKIPGVQGVGEGRDAIGDPAWLVYVKDKSVAKNLPGHVGGRKVVSAVTGEIDILPAGPRP
ncbi:MAG: hypothetical protein WCE79_01640 [Xanthobacteraceae bacterium]